MLLTAGTRWQEHRQARIHPLLWLRVTLGTMWYQPMSSAPETFIRNSLWHRTAVPAGSPGPMPSCDRPVLPRTFLSPPVPQLRAAPLLPPLEPGRHRRHPAGKGNRALPGGEPGTAQPQLCPQNGARRERGSSARGAARAARAHRIPAPAPPGLIPELIPPLSRLRLLHNLLGGRGNEGEAALPLS